MASQIAMIEILLIIGAVNENNLKKDWNWRL